MKVISGGQTGADQAGWRAAKAAGLEVGGWMTKGFRTEDGPCPEFAELYGAKEHESAEYPPRTRANIQEADATFIFAVNSESPGTQLAVKTAEKLGKKESCLTIEVNLGWPINPIRPKACAEWLIHKKVNILNIAGNRESSSPGIGAWVEEYLTEVFRLLKDSPPPDDDR